MGNSSSRSVDLARGGLVDVSNYAKTVGFVFPVALTREVWLTLVNIRYDHSLIERNPRVVEQRILEILITARSAVLGAGDSESTQVSMYRLTSSDERRATGKYAVRRHLRVQCGSGDHAEPVITISLAVPNESDLVDRS